MVEACARRNRRQDVSVDRSGAGGIRRSLRIRRIVDAPTRWSSLSSSPWMRVEQPDEDQVEETERHG
jgi:hypothetical protein